MAITPLRAVIWKAVSSKVQASDDKISLAEQERLAREFANEQQPPMAIVDILEVPGHSRAETDVLTLFEDYAEIGVFAYHKLRAHWQANDFDVLLAFHPNRLGRSFSILALVLENVVKRGRRVYCAQGGWADESNIDGYIALAGYAAKSESRQRTALSQKTLRKKLAEGLPNNRVPFTHRVVRDERGKIIDFVVREELESTFDLLSEMLLQGVGYNLMAYRLNQMGIPNPYGRKWHSGMVYRAFHVPTAWGHFAHGYDNDVGSWAYSENAALPFGVEIWRDVCQPVWTGERSERIKAELMRRAQLVRGRSNSRYHLTGLMSCQLCGRRLVTVWSGKAHNVHYWACKDHYSEQRCANRTYLQDEKAKTQISDFIRRSIERGVVDLSAKPTAEPDRREMITNSIIDIEGQIETLIVQQSKAPSNVQGMYQKRIEALSLQMQEYQSQLDRLPSPSVNRIRQAALKDIAESVNQLWEMDGHVVNALLLKALGKIKFLALNGEIVGIG